MSGFKTKAEAIEATALRLRVIARRLDKPYTDMDLAWDAIAETLNGTRFTADAGTVIREARRQAIPGLDRTTHKCVANGCHCGGTYMDHPARSDGPGGEL